MKRSLAVILVLFIICLQAGCSAKIIHHTPSKPLLQVEVGDTRELEIMLLKPTLRKSAYLWECDEGEFIKKDMWKNTFSTFSFILILRPNSLFLFSFSF